MISVLTASLTVAMPNAAEASTDAERDVEQAKPVPVHPLRPKRTATPEDDAATWKPDNDRRSWPTAGSAEVRIGGAQARAGGLRVSASKPSEPSGRAAGASATPGSVTVTALGKKASDKLGVSGPIFSVAADAATTAPVDLDISYAPFAELYGGDWASRLRLVELPACAATEPTRPECQEPRALASENDVSSRTVSAAVDADGARSARTQAPALYALVADSESDSGDYKATDLAPSGSWTAGSAAGGFEYSQPIRIPSTSGGAPDVALSYSSQSIDGRTAGKNNQASWVGDGWTYAPGFIERSYETCAEDRSTVDGQAPNNASKKTYDQCWRGENATISLNGTSGTLVKDDDTGAWRVESDANWRVQAVKDATLNDYDNDGEYWKVTTPDGTRFYFGREPATSRSTWTAPVFGNHPGEPCHASAFKDSSCTQAWRWNLDTVIDPSGNTAKYYYSRETGHYGAAGEADERVSYIRGGNLIRIEYGLHEDQPTVAAAAKVEFTTADRCFTSPCWNDSKPVQGNWPDVPWDRDCTAAPCTDTLAPSFYTSRRLAAITTYVRSGSTFTESDRVESWNLEHKFLETDVLKAPVLWLKSITHTGYRGTAISDPPVTFTAVGMDNRVDAIDNIDAMHRFRIGNVRTESGADIHVTYSGADCVRGSNMPTSPSSNGKRCYPVYWTPDGFEDPTMDYFHKYVVTEVSQVDGTGGSEPVFTRYSYSTTGGGTSQLWGYDDNELVKKKHRTYGSWRGYPMVTTRVGDGDPGKGPALTTAKRFYRGMDGEPLPDGTRRDVSVSDTEGNTASDHRALAGQVREEVQYNGSAIAEAATSTYWTKLTAQHTYSGGSQKAYLSGPSVQRTRKLLATDSWRRTETRTAYNDEGHPTEVNDLGDTSTSTDDQCTRTTYVDDDTAWLRGLPARTETVSASCAATPSRPDDIVSDTKTFYDGATSSTATPSTGLVTRTDVIDGWADGAARYVTTARNTYDALGRVTETKDAKGRASTTTYTPAGAGPLTKIVATNPAGHVTTTEQNPAFEVPTGIVDPNNKRTDLTYDALGRLTKVWLPGRSKAAQTPHLEFDYLVRNSGPLAVTSKSIAPNGNYLTTINLLDSLYRPRQTQTNATGGGRLIETTHYNERGQVVTTTGPNHATGLPNTAISEVDKTDDRARLVKTYDALGRPTTEQFWSRTVEQWRTTRTYGGNPDGWREAITPPDGGTPTATLTDARGNTKELRQYHGSSPSGDYDATTYTYTPSDALKTITLPDGRTVRYTYDLRGRQITNDDPDKGVTGFIRVK